MLTLLQLVVNGLLVLMLALRLWRSVCDADSSPVGCDWSASINACPEAMMVSVWCWLFSSWLCWSASINACLEAMMVCVWCWLFSWVGNLLIGFLSELLVFCKIMSKWAICSKNDRFTHLIILVSNSLMVSHFWWSTWAIRSHHSFLVSNLSDLLTLLIKKEGMSKLHVFLKKRIRIYNFSHIF